MTDTTAGASPTVEGGRPASAGRPPLPRLVGLPLPNLVQAPAPSGSTPVGSDPWLLAYDSFDPADEGTREALCTVGNGYWATRGAVPGSVPDAVHYPGTYLAGVYNRVVTEGLGGPFETEHLVNSHDWTALLVESPDGTALHPSSADLVGYRQELDLRRGVLTRTMRHSDQQGRITTVTTEQFQSMAEPHLAALRMTVQAENWHGDLRVVSSIDGRSRNTNVAADRRLETQHFTPGISHHLDEWTVLLESRTIQSGITVATAARTSLHPSGVLSGSVHINDEASAGLEFHVQVAPGAPVVIEKVAAVATSRDRALSTPLLDASHRIRRVGNFDALLSVHVSRWSEMWDRFGVVLQTGHRQSLALNLHTFHVLQSTASAEADLDAGVPARGLHGEGYRGHIFWDELFVYPLLTLRRPALTRALLLYRHRRLGEARAAAREVGLRGALFPWQSGSDGREETPSQLYNERSGQWMPDNSRRQRHVGLAVAYSVWQYYQATQDLEFLTDVGAEILIEVARLFASSAAYDGADDRFSITGVMGPDEYHDGYPGAPGAGVRDNAYTNVLASWTLARAADALTLLAHHDAAALRQRLEVTHEEMREWDHIGRRLRVPFHADGVISQFDGYERLQEFPWDEYRRRYENIGRLDLILAAEGDSTNKYRLSKQADVLMLFYLFPAEELKTMFARLGYPLSPETIPKTVDFYLSRTSHGSTLSRLVHSWVLARTDRARSWSLFEQVLEADLADTQGGTTREGIHLGAMAGTADMVIRCYGGVETRADTLRLHPLLPSELPAASFHLRYRNQPIDVDITQDSVRLRLHHCSARSVRVCIQGIEKTLRPGDRWEHPLSAPARLHLPADSRNGEPEGLQRQEKA